MPKSYRKLHKHELCNITVIMYYSTWYYSCTCINNGYNESYYCVCITVLIIATERFQFHIEVIHRILLIIVHMYFNCTE